MSEQAWQDIRCFQCDECGHVFTEAEVKAEDNAAWGHPCPPHSTRTKRLKAACESYRVPVRLVPLPPPSGEANTK